MPAQAPTTTAETRGANHRRRPDPPRQAVDPHAPAGHPDQRREGADRPAEADDRDRLPLRRDRHRGRSARDRLQLLQAGRRSGAVCARPGDRRQPDRRGSERHRQDLHQTALGRRFRRSQRRRHPGDRGHRHRAVRPQGQAGWPSAGEAAGGVPGLGADVQHLWRVPARSDRGGQGAGHAVAGRGDRRDQDQGRSAGQQDRPGAGDRGPGAPR